MTFVIFGRFSERTSSQVQNLQPQRHKSLGMKKSTRFQFRNQHAQLYFQKYHTQGAGFHRAAEGWVSEIQQARINSRPLARPLLFLVIHYWITRSGGRGSVLPTTSCSGPWADGREMGCGTDGAEKEYVSTTRERGRWSVCLESPCEP